jgi:transposase
VSEVIAGDSKPVPPKRIHRSVEEKRRIVEATFAPGTSIARVAREHGVNAKQIFQWRCEYSKGILGERTKPAAKLLPVVVEEPEVARAPHSVTLQPNSNGTIRIDLPGGVSLHIERDTDLELLRAIVEMLRA